MTAAEHSGFLFFVWLDWNVKLQETDVEYTANSWLREGSFSFFSFFFAV